MQVLKIQEKDKAVIRYDHKTGKYRVHEIVLHDLDKQKLFADVDKFVKALDKDGIVALVEAAEARVHYICQACGNTARAFADNPEEVRWECTSEKCLGKMRDWKLQPKPKEVMEQCKN